MQSYNSSVIDKYFDGSSAIISFFSSIEAAEYMRLVCKTTMVHTAWYEVAVPRMT